MAAKSAAFFLRACVPPSSSRQYQSAKTRTLLSQRAAPEPRSFIAGSLCAGSVVMSRTTELMSESVMMELITVPRM